MNRNRFAIVVLSLILFSVVDVRVTAAQMWIGGGDGSTWNDGANWDGGEVPEAESLALITSFSPVMPFDVSVNQSTIAGLVFVENSILNFNADFSGFASVSGGAVNLNAGTLSGDLSLGGTSFFGDATENTAFNRTGGVLALNSLGIGGPGPDAAAIDLLGSDSVLNANVGENGVLNINDGTISDSLQVNAGGIANLNSGSVSGTQNIDGGTLNLNGGSLTGELSLNNTAGTDPTFNKTGGIFDLTSLDLGGNASFVISGTDNVRGNISVSEGAQMTINRELVLERLVNSSNFFTNGSLVANEGSTIFLNANITQSELVEFNGDSLQRADGVSISTQTLVANSTDYVFDGTDTITGSIEINDGTLDVVQGPPGLPGITINSIEFNGFHQCRIKLGKSWRKPAVDNQRQSSNERRKRCCC